MLEIIINSNNNNNNDNDNNGNNNNNSNKTIMKIIKACVNAHKINYTKKKKQQYMYSLRLSSLRNAFDLSHGKAQPPVVNMFNCQLVLSVESYTERN